jgi:chromosome segregation ATPase
MIEKVLNKIGFYTARQMREIELYVGEVEVKLEKYISLCDSLKEENEKLKDKTKRLISSLKISEEVKSNAVREIEELRKENEKLKIRVAKSVKMKRR